MTINELSKEFMEKYAKRKLRPNTIRGYETNIRKHILPVLGEKQADQITEKDIDELGEALAEKILNAKSMIYVHATLRKMLNYGNKKGWFQNTVYSIYDLPRVEEYKHTILKEEEIEWLLRWSWNWDDPVHVAVKLALKYGMRRGEILGLKKEDVDAVNNIIHIQRTRSFENGKEIITPCKTKNSNRYILVKEVDRKALLKERPGNRKWLIDITPTQLDKQFQKHLKNNGIKHIRFHDLRHSYATLMLQKGVNPKIVSTVLGHSGVQVTLNIYSHPDVSMQVTCLEAFDTLKRM